MKRNRRKKYAAFLVLLVGIFFFSVSQSSKTYASVISNENPIEEISNTDTGADADVVENASMVNDGIAEESSKDDETASTDGGSTVNNSENSEDSSSVVTQGNVGRDEEDKEVSVYAGESAGSNDPYAAEVTFENESVRGSIEVTKYKDDKKTKLKGVSFKLSDAEGNTVEELTTGDDGIVLFENLMPGIYTITETKTVDGYTLLKDPIVVNLPYPMEKAKADADGVDVKKAAEYDGFYYFFNLRYDVANDVTLNIPMTGFFDSWTNYVGVVGAIVLICIGVLVLNNKKKTVQNR